MMDRDRLNLLFLSPFPPSPPTFGAQRRVQGLMSALARRHQVTGVAVVTTDYDPEIAERAMREYCAQVVLVRTRAREGAVKRLLQLGSLFRRESFVRTLYDLRALRKELDALLSARRYDVVTVELPFIARTTLARAPPGERRPRLVLDEHNIEFDLARQQARNELGAARRVYNAVNWRKIRSEELGVWSRFDGVAFCSETDRARARALLPTVRSALVPNAVDVEYFRRSPSHPARDGRTLLFFGALNYFPNEDGVLYFLREVWPLIEAAHPQARLKIIGQQPTPEIAARRSPRIEIAGTVDDLRPHLAGAAVSIVPLRLGGGTRFKILESMAMGTPVVSTTLGAEGIDAEPDRHLLLGDDAKAFAASVGRVLGDAQLGARLAAEGRALVERSYSWDAAAQAMEGFYREILAAER